MKLSKIYIISWFGNDTELRAKRKEIHKKQVEWVYSHNLHPVIYAQEYEPDDFLVGPTYVVNTGYLKHPGPARNILLKNFYDSDDDYAVFADNDSLLYEGERYGNTNDFFKKLRSLDIKDPDFSNVDIIGVTNPGRSPFREETEKPIYNDNLVFKRTTQLKGSMFLVRNRKKFYNRELVFDEENFVNEQGKMIGGEELCFAVDAMMTGLGVFTTFNAILKELASNQSTWAGSSHERELLSAKRIINKNHGQNIFKITEDNLTTFETLFGDSEEKAKVKTALDWKKFDHNTKLKKQIAVKFNR